MRLSQMSMLVVCSILLGSLPARADTRPDRNGFTLELGIGGSVMHVMTEGQDTQNEVGLAPLSLSLGGFLNNRMAVMLRLSGVSFFEDNAEEESSQIVLSFLGAHFQYWLSDSFFVSGGPGLAMYGFNPLMKSDQDPDTELGFGLGLRAGFSFLTWKNHSLRISLELMPGFFADSTVMGESVSLEWQWF